MASSKHAGCQNRELVWRHEILPRLDLLCMLAYTSFVYTFSLCTLIFNLLGGFYSINIRHTMRICYPSLLISVFAVRFHGCRQYKVEPEIQTRVRTGLVFRAVFHIVCLNKSWNTVKFDLLAERGRLVIWFHSEHMLCRNALRGALVSSMRRCGHVFRSWQRGAAVLFCSESKSGLYEVHSRWLQWAMSACINIKVPCWTDSHENWLKPLGRNQVWKSHEVIVLECVGEFIPGLYLESILAHSEMQRFFVVSFTERESAW